MRNKQPRGVARDIISFKDSYESFDLEEVKFTHKSAPPSSPVSIVAELPIHLPEIKPLPSAVLNKTRARPPAPASTQLPPTAVWGARHKTWKARCGERASLLTVLDLYPEADEYCATRARLPMKTCHLQSKAERRVKAMERGLMNKHWNKRRTARRAARKAHEARLLFEQMAQVKILEKEQEHEARRATDEALETDDDDEAAEEVFEEAEMCANRTRKTGLKRDKIRRARRREVRAHKCFDADDPVERDALEPEPKAPPDVTAQAKARTPPPLPLTIVKVLISGDSRGAPLSDAVRGGVPLSSVAARDLQAVDEALRLDPQLLPKRSGMSPDKKPRRKPARGKMAKGGKGGGAAAYLRQRSMIKEQGKRHS